VEDLRSPHLAFFTIEAASVSSFNRHFDRNLHSVLGRCSAACWLHCGGQGPDTLDMHAAVEKCVEEGIAPDRMIDFPNRLASSARNTGFLIPKSKSKVGARASSIP
jgi:hypothetical protein